MDPTTDINPACASVLTENCLIAKSLHDQQGKIELLTKSKLAVKQRNPKLNQQLSQILLKTDKDGITETNRTTACLDDIEGRIQELRADFEEIESKLTEKEDAIMKKVISKLTDATDILSKMDQTTVDDLLFDKQPYLEQIECSKKEIEELKTNKLDIAKNREQLENTIKETEKLVRLRKEQDDKEYTSTLDQHTRQLEYLEQRLLQLFSDQSLAILQEEAKRKILGLPSIAEERKNNQPINIPELVRKEFRDHLGQFLSTQVFKEAAEAVLKPSTKSLPVKDSGYIKVRKHETSKLRKSLYKVARMKKEVNEAISLCENNLNPDSIVLHALDKLAYADRIAQNHKEVLDFLNAPFGKCTDKMVLELSKKENIPTEISLFSEDMRLSTALVTSITKYTQKLIFTDLTQRVENLEKKLM